MQAEGAQHVGSDHHHHGDIHHLHRLQGARRPGDRCAEKAADAIDGVETEEDVPGAPVEQAERRIDLQRAADDHPAVLAGLGAQEADERRHHVVADHQQAGEAPGLAVGDGALFHVGFSAGNLVVVEV
ncbi:hypothetical protein FQZ97_750360 [compost metagenome]